ncbi:MAG: diaminopimelate epimerase [Clostridia bacterium]|nr:diaminopimelate epimerase [Clostridia bacterium]
MKQELHYVLLDPTGNITALVTDPLPPARQPSAAAQLMQKEPTCEQVGFVKQDHLRMAGGEFCGNAALSAAALYCRLHPLPQADERLVSLLVFGQENAVEVRVTPQTERTFFGTVSMPLPLAVAPCTLRFAGETYALTRVDFAGMTHLIAAQPIEKQTAEKAIKVWCEALKAEALGIMLLSENNRRITPLVYVPAADTLFWESSCASGTAAAAAALSHGKNGERHYEFDEPGGRLCVDAAPDHLLLSGRVTIQKESSFIYREA